jgi:hypothetical protein
MMPKHNFAKKSMAQDNPQKSMIKKPEDISRPLKSDQ